jgi:hypothetical protein
LNHLTVPFCIVFLLIHCIDQRRRVISTARDMPVALHATSQILGGSPKRSCGHDSTGQRAQIPIAGENKPTNAAQAWLLTGALQRGLLASNSPRALMRT